MEFGLVIYVLTAIFFAILGIAYSVKKKLSVEQFISSKNSLNLWSVIATIFASGMGAWLLFGPAETMLWNGIIALAGYALSSALSLWIFIWLGVKIRKLMPKGHSVVEYVLHRFGKTMYFFVLVISIFFMGLAMAAELTGISLAGMVVYGIPLWISALIIILGVLLYVMIGGFKASVFTDKIQTGFILPLFAIIVVGMFMISGNVIPKAVGQLPELFSLGNIEGWKLAITLIIAIVSAELFNQSWWQRVYAAKNEKTMKRGFFIAGLLIIPVVFIAGLLGLFAIGTPAIDNPSVALFATLLAMPQWLLTIGMVLAVALVMSSLDTSLNAMVSIFTVDFKRLKPNIEVKKLLNVAKIFVFIIALVGLYIATKGMSVFYLFLLADLFTVAIVFPIFYGLFEGKITGKVAVYASLFGLLGGFYYFPDSNFTRGNLLLSFIVAFIVPTIISIIFSNGNEYDYSKLKKKVDLMK